MEKQEDREQLWRWCIAGTDVNQGWLGKCIKISMLGDDWCDLSETDHVVIGGHREQTLDYVPGQPAHDATLRLERALVLNLVSVPMVLGKTSQGEPNIQVHPANTISLPLMLKHMPMVDLRPTWIIWLRNLHSSDQAQLMRFHAGLSAQTSGLTLPGVS